MFKHATRTVRRSTLAVTGRFSRIVSVLLKDEAASGKFLVVALCLAMLAMNSPWSTGYSSLWQQHFSISLGNWAISDTLQRWVNEGLMAIFFLVVGLEIKRELVRGELRTLRAAILPIACAIGGMVVPAAIYMLINKGQAGFDGWGIPMTTDIALAVGVLALLNNRIPSQLRLFLLTLAVVDDIGAIMVIALFYAHDVHIVPLLAAIGVLCAVGVLQWLRLLRLGNFVLLGVLLWLALYHSGVHAAIAGALLGLSAPIASRNRHKKAIAGRLERFLIPVSAFVIVPLFALANAGVTIHTDSFDSHATWLVGVGIITGLVLGKVAGIVGAAWLLVRLRFADLPGEVSWSLLTGTGLLAGIGLTLSVFIAEVAFGTGPFEAPAKLSVLAASVLSACGGLVCLYIATRGRAQKSDLKIHK